MGILVSGLLILVLIAALICAICGVFCHKNGQGSQLQLWSALMLVGISGGLATVVLHYEQSYATAEQTFMTIFKETYQNFKDVKRVQRFEHMDAKQKRKLYQKTKRIARESYLNSKVIMQHAINEMNENKTLFRLQDYHHAKQAQKLLQEQYDELTH